LGTAGPNPSRHLQDQQRLGTGVQRHRRNQGETCGDSGLTRQGSRGEGGAKKRNSFFLGFVFAKLKGEGGRGKEKRRGGGGGGAAGKNPTVHGAKITG